MNVIINVLIGWSILTTVVILFMISNNEDRQAQINKMELDIKKNRIYDIVVEEHATHYHPSYYDDYQQRVVTMKEAIACLYKKGGFHLSYTPEKTETVGEDVSIR